MAKQPKTLFGRVNDSYRNLIGAAVLGIAALGAGKAAAVETHNFTARENRTGETTIVDVLGGRAGTIDSVGTPGKGTARIILQGGKQVIEYTPNAGQHDVPDGFPVQYTTGGVPHVAVASGTINGAPTANDDNVTAVQGQTKTFYPLANDTDPTNDAMRIVAVSPSTLGNGVEIRGGTELRYTAANPGLDALTVETEDAAGNRNTSMLTIDTDAVPTLADLVMTINKNGSVNGRLVVTDADAGDVHTFSLSDLVQENGGATGVATLDPATGALAYTAPANKGKVVATAGVDDGRGGSATGIVTIDVTNTPPTGLDADKQGFEGDSISYTIMDLAGADKDADGDVITIDSIVVPQGITATVSPDRKSVTVNGARGILGHYDIGVRLTDGDEGYANANAGATFVARDASQFPQTPTEKGLEDIITALRTDPTLSTLGGRLLTKTEDGRMAFLAVDGLPVDEDKPGFKVLAALRKKNTEEGDINKTSTKRVVVTYDGKAYMTWDAAGNINMANPAAADSRFGMTIRQPMQTYAALDLKTGARGEYATETPAPMAGQVIKPGRDGVPTATAKPQRNKNALQYRIAWGINAPSVTAPELRVSRETKMRQSVMFQPTDPDGSTFLPVAGIEGHYNGPLQNDLTGVVTDGAETPADQFGGITGKLVTAVDGVRYVRVEYANQPKKPDTAVALPSADFTKTPTLGNNFRQWFKPGPVSASDYGHLLVVADGKVIGRLGAVYKPNYTTPQAETGLAVKKGSVHTAHINYDVTE